MDSVNLNPIVGAILRIALGPYKAFIDKLEKDKKISQDEQKRAIEEMEKISHAETKKIEDFSAAKEKEILELK